MIDFDLQLPSKERLNKSFLNYSFKHGDSKLKSVVHDNVPIVMNINFPGDNF